MKVGMGFDFHPFEKNGELFLGGIKITDKYGFKGHSDGDVIIHSLVDAILGALGKGDIGLHFPDTDKRYKNASSKIFLEHVIALLQNERMKISNADITFIGEKPKINMHRDKIKTNLENLISAPVNIKATTMEKLGTIGREEGAAAMSIVLLEEL